jgi:hypothetical protein
MKGWHEKLAAGAGAIEPVAGLSIRHAALLEE